MFCKHIAYVMMLYFTFMIISEIGGSSKKNINFCKLADSLRTIDDQVNFLQVTIFHKCSLNVCVDFRNKIFFHPLSHVTVVILSSLKFILTANLAKISSLSDLTPSSAMLKIVCVNSYIFVANFWRYKDVQKETDLTDSESYNDENVTNSSSVLGKDTISKY